MADIDDAILAALGEMDSDETDSTTDEPEAPAAEETEEDEQTDETDGDESEEDETEVDDDPEAPAEGEEPEDDEDADESDEDEDDEDVEDDDGSELVLDEDTVLVLPDGTEVTARELTDGYLRQADYTRKTQELATERKEVQDIQDKMVSWFDQRSKNPSAWIAEIASVYAEDSGSAIAGALAAAEKPDVALAGVLRHLVESGKLSDKLVERLGLTQIAEEAKATAGEERIARLERQQQEQRQQTEAQRQQQQHLQEFQTQWRSIVEDEGIQFESPEAERAELIELMRFARDQQITNLRTAFAARAYLAAKDAPAPTTKTEKPARKQAKEAVERKRKAAVVGRQSNAGGTGSQQAPAGDLDSAISMAFEKHGVAL